MPCILAKESKLIDDRTSFEILPQQTIQSQQCNANMILKTAWQQKLIKTKIVNRVFGKYLSYSNILNRDWEH